MILTKEEIIKIKESDPKYYKNKLLKKFFKDLYPHLKTIKEKIHYHIYGPNYCKTCGKEIKPFRNFCSTKCSKKNPEVQEKFRQTNLLKYGAENPSQSNKIKEKKK